MCKANILPWCANVTVKLKNDCQCSDKDGPELDWLWNWPVNIWIIMIFFVVVSPFLPLTLQPSQSLKENCAFYPSSFPISSLPIFCYFNNSSHSKRKDPSSPTKSKIKIKVVKGCSMTFANGNQPALKHMLHLACPVPFPFIKLSAENELWSFLIPIL